MWYLIFDFFELILRVFLKFALDIIGKNLGISKTFSKKDLELLLYDKNSIWIVLYILGQFKTDIAIKKKGSK